MLCGFLCCDTGDPVTHWLDQILPLTQPDDLPRCEGRDVLRDYAEPVEKAIRGTDLTIDLPIFDENAPLIERATAIYDWVRGFLYAMGILGISEHALSEDAREVYGDFVSVTHMDLDDLDETEENEQALAEVIEFIRVAAMLIQDARIDPRPQADQR